jgi:formylglycine-generating enzyme
MRALFSILLSALAFVSAEASEPVVVTNMIRIPAGYYVLPFREPNDPKQVTVTEFLLDARPVTNADFLEFVKANPNWQKSQVKRLFADENYLGDWAGDLEIGTKVHTNAPVTRVSWFAARAYARWSGKRLPTTAEWEYVAQADEKTPNASENPAFRARLQSLYLTLTPDQLRPVGTQSANYFGAYDLHGLVWEWVADFSTAMVTGDARGDTGLDRLLFCGGGGLAAKDQLDFPTFMRFAFRSSLKASYTVPNLGFRCAKDL